MFLIDLLSAEAWLVRVQVVMMEVRVTIPSDFWSYVEDSKPQNVKIVKMDTMANTSYAQRLTRMRLHYRTICSSMTRMCSGETPVGLRQPFGQGDLSNVSWKPYILDNTSTSTFF